jgi:hypothetical protein
VADKRITELNPLSGAGVSVDVDVLAIADVSAAETKKITPKDLVGQALGALPPDSIDGDVILNGSISGTKLAENSVTNRELAPNAVDTENIINASVTNEKLADGIDGGKLLNGSVTGDKLEAGAVGGSAIADRSIEGVKLVQNTLTADEIAPNAIGASELANGAVGTTELQDDACSTPKYQNLSVTNEKLADGIDGAKLLDGSVDANKLSGSIGGDQIDSVPLDKLPNAPANTVLAGPESGGAATSSFRRLAGADLPAATTTTKGGVSVPAAGGLSVDGAGALQITNNVAPNTFPVITYNSHGLVTGGRQLQNADLPPAAPGQIGGVKPGAGITIAPDGTISQSTTGVTAGTYPKVTVDERGNVTAGMALEASDIPAMDINDLNGSLNFGDISGEITTGQLADKSVTRRKLADYAITFIQEAPPSVDSTVHVGCLWFQESIAGLHMWNGNSWLSVGQGRLSAENLRYCGLVDASTGLITGLTPFGISEGFQIGDAVPAPSDELTGVYFVVEVDGNSIAQLPGVAFDAGDWCLCNGNAAGWVRIDTMTGGGSGGGATRLGELLDVDIAGAAEGALLQLQASGMWRDVYVIDAGDY